jgi:diguanylate cyclase (GGDEF)-like protein
MTTGADEASLARRASDVVTPLVLVVDDSSTIRRILTRDLTAAGYRVGEASDGREGLAQVRATRPDLVLLDVDMPVMTGPEALRELRADPVVGDTPVLFLTARTSAADVAHGLELGAQDYLRKPCEPAELVARVRIALAVRTQARSLEAQAARLDEISRSDRLTGLGNRVELDLVVERWRMANPEQQVAVCLADVDHFKRVNDSFGHQIGDAVLVIVAERLRHLSAADPRRCLVRWGGEEFLLLHPGGDVDGAHDLAEDVCRVIREHPFTVGMPEPLAITVSVGACAGSIGDLEALIRQSDRFLYDAKEAGRDRVRSGPHRGSVAV